VFNSIKLKLVILFLVVFSVVFTGLEVFLYYKLEGVVISLVDDHLDVSVNSLSNLLTIEEGHGQSIEKEMAEIALTATGEYAKKLSGHYYQVLYADGTVAVRSPSLSLADAMLPPETPEPGIALHETITGPAGEQLRMITRSVNFAIGPLIFQVADSLDDTYVLVSSFRNIILYIFPAFFVLCGVGVFFITGWALNSLKSFSAKVGEITEESLSERVEERGVVSELKPMAANFNTMLGRLEGSFMKQRQFLSDASHELRTPTAIIKSFCEVTLAKDRPAEDYRAALEKIGSNVNRMHDIINRILVISRLDSKAMQLRPVRIDLKEIMKDVITLIEPTAASKGIEISFSGPSVTIRGDREGITEVLTNMVENAVKYNRPDGRVEVEVSESGEFAVVSVTDTGIGIPAAEKEKIFDRFYRVDTSRGLTVGSGLGLSIVRTIAEAHGGRVEVESEEGHGSTFRVFLPKEPRFKGTS